MGYIIGLLIGVVFSLSIGFFGGYNWGYDSGYDDGRFSAIQEQLDIQSLIVTKSRAKKPKE